ncbi:MAG: outer membrane protein assembly factor BamB [Phenylobacterium sp.]|jgi:outer membrane protein assembly factor BamB
MSQEHDWWTYHGNSQRTGCVRGSGITADNVEHLKIIKSMQLGGPIMSTPAIAEGYIYVGTANSVAIGGEAAENGGHLHRIELATGNRAGKFSWPTSAAEGDTHGFCGMGCTPTVCDGFVYFSAFDGHLYCLEANESLSCKWKINLRNPDPQHKQPVNNDNGQAPKAEGWSSPLVVDGKIYVGIGEGENDALFGFIFCLDASSGDVLWIFCTNQFEQDKDNAVNQLPSQVLSECGAEGYSSYCGFINDRGSSVWTALSYDEQLGRIYATTGNPAPEDNGVSHTYSTPDGLNNAPPPKYSYGILSLDAQCGDFKGFYQMDAESSYRSSDTDVDFGASPIVFNLKGRRVVGAACKNGSFVIVDADTMALVEQRQMLPYYNDGTQIPTVDPHGTENVDSPNPVISNEASNSYPAENFHGTYSTPAIDDDCDPNVFICLGGNNYHYIAPGNDAQTTPFMRAMDSTNKLNDSWPMETVTVLDPVYAAYQSFDRYRLDNVTMSSPDGPVGMYMTNQDSGISSPAVANDVVFCSTTKVALYAFRVSDGKLLWTDVLGSQTGGFNGGYGYCLGPAVAGNYVVAGGLILGTGEDSDGGILRIYHLDQLDHLGQRRSTAKPGECA